MWGVVTFTFITNEDLGILTVVARAFVDEMDPGQYLGAEKAFYIEDFNRASGNVLLEILLVGIEDLISAWRYANNVSAQPYVAQLN